jgi:murein DD-endopeptidase MepM/ murein hydrolase activator NlpD
MDCGGCACGRSKISILACAERQTWIVLTFRICVEHARRHHPASLRYKWCWKRRHYPALGPIPQEGAAEVYNNRTLSDLRLKTADRFLFSQPFARQSHSQAEASFADVRNYIYQGKKIDQQVHLGYDLAVTQHVGVEASNDGRVVYAAPLGIYGNCIVVDHGYGLQTIYGHLSHIEVHEGDLVKRGQVMGQSGMTGMAGGDHIHFAMQLDGVQIDPKEWWDSHWIQDHVARRVDLLGFKK